MQKIIKTDEQSEAYFCKRGLGGIPQQARMGTVLPATCPACRVLTLKYSDRLLHCIYADGRAI